MADTNTAQTERNREIADFCRSASSVAVEYVKNGGNKHPLLVACEYMEHMVTMLETLGEDFPYLEDFRAIQAKVKGKLEALEITPSDRTLERAARQSIRAEQVYLRVADEMKAAQSKSEEACSDSLAPQQ